LTGYVSNLFQSVQPAIGAAWIDFAVVMLKHLSVLPAMGGGTTNQQLESGDVAVMWNVLRRTEYCESDREALAEETFQKLLHMEWKRSNRSRRRFVLMLLEPGIEGGTSDLSLKQVLRALPISTRETDIVGWYRNGSVIGVIFTEIGAVDDTTVRNVLYAKVTKVLYSTLRAEQADQLRLSFQLFPNSEAELDTRVAARHRDLVRSSRHEAGASSEVFALKATNASS
jgi:hypothetical protein